jgi:hypothetical protein
MEQEYLNYFAILTNEWVGLASWDLLTEVRIDEAIFIRLLGIDFNFLFID